MIIHETSIVHPSSKIDDSVEIGPFCIVGENVEIKKDTKLLSHVVIKGPTSIGLLIPFRCRFLSCLLYLIL